MAAAAAALLLPNSAPLGVLQRKRVIEGASGEREAAGGGDVGAGNGAAGVRVAGGKGMRVSVRWAVKMGDDFSGGNDCRGLSTHELHRRRLVLGHSRSRQSHGRY